MVKQLGKFLLVSITDLIELLYPYTSSFSCKLYFAILGIKPCDTLGTCIYKILKICDNVITKISMFHLWNIFIFSLLLLNTSASSTFASALWILTQSFALKIVYAEVGPKPAVWFVLEPGCCLFQITGLLIPIIPLKYLNRGTPMI